MLGSTGARPADFGMKLALWAGFGGVLALMAVAGIDSIRVLHRLEAGHAELTRSYLEHHHAFERIQSLIYGFGDLVRDYFAEPDPVKAGLHIRSLRKFHSDIQTALDKYSDSVTAKERPLFTVLESRLAVYWDALEPALRWDAEARRTHAQAFLRRELLPRSAGILEFSEKIDAANEQMLGAGDRRSAQVFERFRRRTIGMLGLTLVFGFAVAAMSIVHILRLEKESRSRYDEILRARGELQRLSAKLVDAQEEERRAISRELHDEIGQSLSALLVDLSNLTAVAPCAGNPETASLLTVIRNLAENTLRAARNMALLLRPPMLDDFGLVPALEWQAREVSRRTGMHVEVVAEGVADELPDEHKTCIYRVVQEALHNCARHANARNARIVVAQSDQRLVLTVQDDGRGFEAARTRGLGLIGMEERVKNIGGTFELRAAAGQGTLLRAALPLPQAAAPVSETTV